MLQQIGRQIAKFPNYYRAFGMWHGPRLLLQIERHLGVHPANIRPHTVPGFEAPIWLRDSVPDHAIFWQVMVMRQYDLAEFHQTARLRSAYDAMIREGRRPVIIDCGGNIGLSAIWFARHFPDAVIYVLEPESRNFEILSRNVASFADRIQALQGGVWNESGLLTIRNPDAGSAAFRVDAIDQACPEAIRAYSISEVLEIAADDEALIVKLDIEGSQKALFSSHTDWVGRSHLIILELDDWLFPWEGTSRPFFSCLSRYAFDYLMRGENIFCFQVAAGLTTTPKSIS